MVNLHIVTKHPTQSINLSIYSNIFCTLERQAQHRRLSKNSNWPLPNNRLIGHSPENISSEFQPSPILQLHPLCCMDCAHPRASSPLPCPAPHFFTTGPTGHKNTPTDRLPSRPAFTSRRAVRGEPVTFWNVFEGRRGSVRTRQSKWYPFDGLVKVFQCLAWELTDPGAPTYTPM